MERDSISTHSDSGVLAAASFLLLWSSGSIFAKLGLQFASPWSFLLLRCGLAATLLVAFISRKRLSAVFLHLTATGMLPYALLSGMLLQAGYQSFYFLALYHLLSPGLLAIILAIQPLCVAVLSRDRLTGFGWCVLVLGFLGVTCALYGAHDLSGYSAVGASFGLGATIAASTGAVIHKRVGGDIFAIAAIQYVMASVFFFGLVLSDGWRVEWTICFAVSLSWMTLAVSLGATLLLFRMLAREAASRVSSLFYIVPVCTIGLDAIVFGQEVSRVTWLGISIVLASVWSFGRRRESIQGPR